MFLYAYLVAVSVSEQCAHTAGTAPVSDMGVSTQSTQWPRVKVSFAESATVWKILSSELVELLQLLKLKYLSKVTK